MLEVEVMEINRKSLEAIGIRYPSQIAVGVQGRQDTGNGSFVNIPGQLSLAELKHFNSDLGVFSITDPVLALNLLHEDTDTNLLANPHIRVKNREKAKIHIGDRIPVITSIANATGFVSESVSYIEVGIKLDVEPTILLKDEVSIKVGLEVSNQTDQVRSSSGTLTYTIGTRNANTVLRLKDGETQVLAGLFRDDTQSIKGRVPGLASLPLIGWLFSDRNDDRRKKEIVLLITPRILSNIKPPDAVFTSFPSGIDDTQGSSNKTVRQSAYEPAATAPIQTPDEAQKDRARNDKSFADSVTMQPIDEMADPANIPVRPQ
jgi:general secretion pathway protein D